MYSLHSDCNTFDLFFFYFFTVITESNLKDTRLDRKRPPTLVSCFSNFTKMQVKPGVAVS